MLALAPQWQAWVLDEEASLPHFKAAYDLGINTWDTADIYSQGASEIIVGKVRLQTRENGGRQAQLLTLPNPLQPHRPSRSTNSLETISSS